MNHRVSVKRIAEQRHTIRLIEAALDGVELASREDETMVRICLATALDDLRSHRYGLARQAAAQALDPAEAWIEAVGFGFGGLRRQLHVLSGVPAQQFPIF